MFSFISSLIEEQGVFEFSICNQIHFAFSYLSLKLKLDEPRGHKAVPVMLHEPYSAV